MVRVRTGISIQRPGTRSSRSTLTSLSLITAPVLSLRKTKVGAWAEFGSSSLGSPWMQPFHAGNRQLSKIHEHLSHSELTTSFL